MLHVVLEEDKLAGHVAVAEAEGDQRATSASCRLSTGSLARRSSIRASHGVMPSCSAPRPDSVQRRACLRGSPEPGHDLGERDSRLNLIRCRTVAHGGRHRLNQVPLRGIEVAERGRTDPKTCLVTPESHQTSLS